MDISHAINEPVENQDYYKDFEAPQGRRQDVKLPTYITLERDRPSDIPFPEYAIDEDDLDDDEDQDDFYFGSPFYFTFF